ncbi:hypothetical protein F4604DRAFT_1976455 [Suillus subluteus]|nr:hypothetical protein F4604DRAFT_1976455 [Suillus subluteus]
MFKPNLNFRKHCWTIGIYLAGALFSLANWTFLDAAISNPSTSSTDWPDANRMPFRSLHHVANQTFLDAAILSAHAHAPYGDPQIPPPVHVQFVDWVRGICSLLGMLIINLIDKDRIRGDDYGDSTAVWRARLFLFIGFAFMAGGLTYCSNISPYYMSERTCIISRMIRASGPWAEGRYILDCDGWAGSVIIPDGDGWAQVGNM